MADLFVEIISLLGYFFIVLLKETPQVNKPSKDSYVLWLLRASSLLFLPKHHPKRGLVLQSFESMTCIKYNNKSFYHLKLDYQLSLPLLQDQRLLTMYTYIYINRFMSPTKIVHTL